MDASISDERLSQFGEFVVETTGLCFPPARRADLRRGLSAAARELGFGVDLDACARSLMSEPLTGRQFDALASHLTVGETYFFRHSACFDALANRVIPALVRERRAAGARRLRIWSCACCTGEEPYSIAILLRRVIPDIADWDVTLLATDVNPHFLRKAERGVFGQWSFRDTPPWVQAHYFKATGDGRFEVVPEVRRMVRFTQLNLAGDAYPSPLNDTGAMDVIFCRNVLMYFDAAHARQVIERLGRALASGGWLVVGPTEMIRDCAAPCVPVHFDGTVFYRKDPDGVLAAEADAACVVADAGRVEVPSAPPLETPGEMHATAGEPAEPQLPDAAALYVSARGHADRGELGEALVCIDRCIAIDKLDPAAHYLRATVLMERGDIDEAVQSLTRTLYLDSSFPLAHFALGNITRSRGQLAESRRHFENALRLLRRYPADAILADSDGGFAGRFVEAIEAVLGEGMTA